MLYVHPVAALVDDFEFGLAKPRADGIDELLGDEGIGAAADDHRRAAECARRRRVAQPVVPDVYLVGGDVAGDGAADIGQPVELFVAEVRRQFGSRPALCSAVTAKGAKRGDHFVGQLRTGQRDGVSRTRPRTWLGC